MNWRYSVKMDVSAATNAHSFKKVGGVWGVSRMISNGRGRTFGGALNTPT